MSKQNYIDKQEMYDEFVRFKNGDNKAYQAIGKKLLLIAQNYTNISNFIGYTQDRKDEMISDAVSTMLKYIHNYDLSKKNPFAYFTKIAYNAFKQYLNKTNKYNNRIVPLEKVEILPDYQILNLK